MRTRNQKLPGKSSRSKEGPSLLHFSPVLWGFFLSFSGAAIPILITCLGSQCQATPERRCQHLCIPTLTPGQRKQLARLGVSTSATLAHSWEDELGMMSQVLRGEITGKLPRKNV